MESASDASIKEQGSGREKKSASNDDPSRGSMMQRWFSTSVLRRSSSASIVRNREREDDNQWPSNMMKGKTTGLDKKRDFISKLEEMGLRRYTNIEIDKATQGFRQIWLIDSGPSSKVYKGLLEGRMLAIKLLKDTKHVRHRFFTEIKLMSQLSHPNLVKLLGWNFEGRNRFVLVYEFLPNYSLDFHLPSSSPIPDNHPLSWEVRYSRIIVGLASALLYLHKGSENCIVHRNIKSRNILLDSEFNPKLGGFGAAQVTKDGKCDPDLKMMSGSKEYMDPDCRCTHKFSKESDIYAFGVVALQLATGRRASIYDRAKDPMEAKGLPDWVSELHDKGRILEAADPTLGKAFDEQEMKRLLFVGLWCTQTDRMSRPPIKTILHYLLNCDVASPSHFSGDEYHRLMESMHSFTGDSYFHQSNEAHVVSSIPTNAEQGKELTTAFDIGIPPPSPGDTSVEVDGRMRGHRRNIMKGFVDSLHEMMLSEEGLPRFDEALEKIRRYTSSLALAVGPPLDDWNALAQLVLQTLKEREDFLEVSGYQEAFPVNVTSSSLNAEIQENARTIEEDGTKLDNAKECLIHAQRRCNSLEASLKEAREVLQSMEEDVAVMESKKAQNLLSQDRRRRHHVILKQYEYVLFKLSSFTR